MSPYSASIERQHERNQVPGIGHTFICCDCKDFKPVIGRKLLSQGVKQRKWQCAACVIERERERQAWAALEFDIARRSRCADVSIETITRARAMLGLDRRAE